MGKIISSKAYLTPLPSGEVVISFIVKNNNNYANKFISELENKDSILVEAKADYRDRTLKQNNLMWELISIISDKLNGEHTQPSIMKIYGDILVKANVKRTLIAIPEESVDLLRNQFRAVVPTGAKVLTENDTTKKIGLLAQYWVYHGSSSFTTKEMTQLIEILINYAYEAGVDKHKIDSITINI